MDEVFSSTVNVMLASPLPLSVLTLTHLSSITIYQSTFELIVNELVVPVESQFIE